MPKVVVPILDPNYDYSNPPDLFECDFKVFEANRMYPLGYGKEPAMKKLTLDHVEAIDHGILGLLKSIDGPRNSAYNQKLDSDIAKLHELRWFVLHTIYNPGLPYGSENPES